MSTRKQKRKPHVPAKFAVGDRVRVRHGVTDVDYPDMSIGGWAGAVSQVQRNGEYMVLWSRETLDAIDPVFEKRCARDGFELERYWLSEDDLEPDEGGPLAIEHPQEINTKPLSNDDQEDRIRTVFGLDSNDPLPAVDAETLEIYYEYLVESLAFPFQAEHSLETGHLFRHSHIVKVVAPDDSDDEPLIDETHGVLCRARHKRRILVVPLCELEIEKGKPNRRLLKDYNHWFWNWR